jgi:ABC-type uncharacterized transport system YnjBCD substrate-binding protein
MTENGPLLDQLKIMIEKADRSLAAAKRLIDEGDYDFEITVGKDEAVEDLDYAQTIVQSVASYLISKGFVG